MHEWHGFCRIDCRTCELYRVTATHDLEGKKALAEKWGENYKIQFSIEDMNCKGCQSDQVFRLCESCPIKTCCKTRNLESCHHCDEFECNRLSAFYAYQTKQNTKVSYFD